MELTDNVRNMARSVAKRAARKSSLDCDDVEQESLMLAWQAKDDTPLALLRRMMNDRTMDLMRAASRKSRIKSVSNEVLDQQYTPGGEADVIARDFAEAFDATLTPLMRETCDVIRETATLEQAAKLCGVSAGTMRSRKMTLCERFADFAANS